MIAMEPEKGLFKYLKCGSIAKKDLNQKCRISRKWLRVKGIVIPAVSKYFFQVGCSALGRKFRRRYVRPVTGYWDPTAEGDLTLNVGKSTKMRA